MLQVVWLVLTSQSALFQHNYDTIQFVYAIGSRRIVDKFYDASSLITLGKYCINILT